MNLIEAISWAAQNPEMSIRGGYCDKPRRFHDGVLMEFFHGPNGGLEPLVGEWRPAIITLEDWLDESRFWDTQPQRVGAKISHVTHEEIK